MPRIEITSLSHAELRVASTTVAMLHQKIELRRVERVFRALRAGEILIAIPDVGKSQITLPKPTLQRTERYWAAAAALLLHKELGESSAERVIEFLGQRHGVMEALLWLTYRTTTRRGGPELHN